MVTKSSNKINFLNATKFALVSALFFSSNAGAAVILEHAGTVAVGTDYHSNIQYLDNKTKESVYIYSIVPEYRVSALDSKNKWYGSIGIRLEKSSNQTIRDDRDDPFGKIGWVRELESGKLELAAEYQKLSSRVTQFGQTGALAVDGSEVRKSASAAWTHAITPKLDLTTSAEIQYFTFTGIAQLSDFETKDLGFNLMYKFNERVNPYVGVIASDYKANGLLDNGLPGNSRIKYQTYLAGADVTLNSKFKFNASAGMVQFNSSSQDELVGGVTASYLGNKYQVQATLERAVFPTGVNIIEVGDRLAANFIYDLSEVSRFGVGTAVTQSKVQDIDTQELTGFYGHDLSRSWLMRLEVGQRYLKSAGIASADDTQIGVFFTYTSPKFK